MSKQTRYLLTVDSATGVAVKLERLGEAGDLTEVPLSMLAVAIPGAPPAAGAGAPPTPQSMVINIYMGGPQQAAPLSLSVPGLIGPGGPGAYATLAGPGGPGAYATLAAPGAPGAPGQASLSSVTDVRAVSQAQGPGGPGASAASMQGPGGTGSLSGGGEGGSR
ncbi:hypothetical protein [Archangium sp.]|uniref:hypothetical protein n=1 Tax=Archangium sp. TaxID=1872627 RepID=UPI002D690725|nr:hypothetical protein [Archangium sp.]HYO59994.1 hypothetical protein [Archangium sp.]